MEETKPLPPPLQELVTRGVLRSINDTDFAIDGLTHDIMTGSGWETLTFTLRQDEFENDDLAIVGESRYSGDDYCLISNDPEEIEAWIINRIEEMDA